MVSACSNAKSCNLTLRVIIAFDVMLKLDPYLQLAAVKGGLNRQELRSFSPAFFGTAIVLLKSIIAQRALVMVRLGY